MVQLAHCGSALQIYNVNDLYDADAEFPVDVDVNMAKVMGVFLAQLR